MFLTASLKPDRAKCPEDDLLAEEPIDFCYLGAHAKIKNPTTTAWAAVDAEKRHRKSPNLPLHCRVYSKQRSSISVALPSVQGQVGDLTLSAVGRDLEQRLRYKKDVIKALTCLYSKRRSSITIALPTVRVQVSDLTVSAVGRVWELPLR